MTTPLELGLLVFILTCAVATALLRDVLGSIIAFSAYSLAIAVAWVFLRAPDVGLTEAAVGAGVMTVLFLLTIAKTVRPSSDRTLERVDLPALAVSVALVAVLATTLFALPAAGAADSAVATDDVTAYYLDNAYEETQVKNAVTAVLAAYRGFDTLGEAVVVYAAGVGLLVVLDREVFA
ncbi:cation:proton antiporter [Halobacteriales archaeon QH_10_67_22]|jgi:multicomponent Na+:H+ antiporter subunit B|nr:MAG: cation:proton antiporter [Halobacteriales archaeon QH_10_67_22]